MTRLGKGPVVCELVGCGALDGTRVEMPAFVPVLTYYAPAFDPRAPGGGDEKLPLEVLEFHFRGIGDGGVRLYEYLARPRRQLTAGNS
jgi:hypothetical protein